MLFRCPLRTLCRGSGGGRTGCRALIATPTGKAFSTADTYRWASACSVAQPQAVPCAKLADEGPAKLQALQPTHTHQLCCCSRQAGAVAAFSQLSALSLQTFMQPCRYLLCSFETCLSVCMPAYYLRFCCPPDQVGRSAQLQERANIDQQHG